QVKWSWTYGPATTFAQLGAPLTTDDYALCVYDSGSNLVVSFPAPAGGTCGTKPCWQQTGPVALPTGYKFHDATRALNGLDAIALKAGIATKAKATFNAKGPTLPMSSLSPLNFALPLTVQLQSDGGRCWESAFPSTGVTLSTPTDFKAKGQ